MNAAERVIKLAEALDLGGKPQARILVRSNRRYLMKLGIKPAERGGALTIGKHPIEFAARDNDESGQPVPGEGR